MKIFPFKSLKHLEVNYHQKGFASSKVWLYSSRKLLSNMRCALVWNEALQQCWPLWIYMATAILHKWSAFHSLDSICVLWTQASRWGSAYVFSCIHVNKMPMSYLSSGCQWLNDDLSLCVHVQLKRIPPHCLEGLRGVYSQLEVFTCSKSLNSLEVPLSYMSMRVSIATNLILYPHTSTHSRVNTVAKPKGTFWLVCKCWCDKYLNKKNN